MTNAEENPQEKVVLTGIKYPDKDGGLTIQAKHPSFVALVADSVKMFKEYGGVNYVEWTMQSRDPAFGEFTIIIQRSKGKTPAQRVTEFLKDCGCGNVNCCLRLRQRKTSEAT